MMNNWLRGYSCSIKSNPPPAPKHPAQVVEANSSMTIARPWLIDGLPKPSIHSRGIVKPTAILRCIRWPDSSQNFLIAFCAPPTGKVNPVRLHPHKAAATLPICLRNSAIRKSLSQNDFLSTQDCCQWKNNSPASGLDLLVNSNSRRPPTGVITNAKVAQIECGKLKGKRIKQKKWSGRLDLNQRPLAPQASTLPGCATPRHEPIKL